ncbi:MAG: hypothetical protein JNM93_04755 [Bacteriovoracaceae bacterium]|nr:hypothetical protein [Bacteriovoracaceae bacterium]
METNNSFDTFNFIIWSVTFIIVVFKFLQSICLVPTKTSYIVERFGKYHRTLEAGFHALIPFVDQVAYKLDLKEETVDVPPQECFSKDEVNVEVDGVIYISVVDPVKAAYGVTHYKYAATQLAQTTTRSIIGTLELDRTFEERDVISAKVVEVLEAAGHTWGIRVHRYEVKNLVPPKTVKNAMEKQVTAERNKRAILAKSEGDKLAKINKSEGLKMEMINLSEGEMQKRINEAEGKASEILTIAKATAESIKKVGHALHQKGGEEAYKLQISELFLEKIDKLAKPGTEVILPANLTDFNGWLKNIGISLDN